MRHVLAAALFAASILATTTSAQAKAPPSGFELCGPSACTSISASGDAEPLAIDLFFGGGGSKELWTPLVPAAPFYAMHWSFGDNQRHTGYYVPLLNVFRYVGDAAGPESTTGTVHWMKLGPIAQQAFERLTAKLTPFAAPAPTRVTVGGRPVQDPASYLRLWSVGKPARSWPETRFLRIKATASVASPWTDAAADLRIARRGPYLVRDSSVYRIPVALARLVRARASLR
jgi:hypothetical protein